MARSEPYDSWAAEGRPEHLRWLDELADRVTVDPRLEAHGITVFSAGVELTREMVTVEIAAADADAATAFIRDLHGDRIEVDVVAPAAYVDETVAWECWTGGQAPEDLTVALLDHTDGSDLRAVVAETSSEIVVTLQGPRWQGVSPAIGIAVHKRVRLAAPVGARSVVDGATGRRRPRRALGV